MPAKPDDDRDRTAFPELHTQSQPPSTVAPGKQPPSPLSTWIAESPVTQFRFRILVVDDEPAMRELAQRKLESKNYEVLTAADGLEGLHALGRSLPDLIVSDLNMPRMSGNEFLMVVRERFPHIATIAMSGENFTEGYPSAIQADAFLHKDQHTLNKLCDEVGKLLAASPIRSEGKKNEIAPLFVPRDRAGYLILICPTCLRPTKFEAMTLDGGLHEAFCPSCGTPVKFEINHEIEPVMKRNDA